MIRDVFNTACGRKYMVPQWTVAQLDRACGCELAAVDGGVSASRGLWLR